MFKHYILSFLYDFVCLLSISVYFIFLNPFREMCEIFSLSVKKFIKIVQSIRLHMFCTAHSLSPFFFRKPFKPFIYEIWKILNIISVLVGFVKFVGFRILFNRCLNVFLSLEPFTISSKICLGLNFVSCLLPNSCHPSVLSWLRGAKTSGSVEM